MLAGLGSECVGVAGRTRADEVEDNLRLPFKRLRSRNILHRVLPKSVRKYSPYRSASLLVSFANRVGADRILCHYGTVADEYQEAWDRLDIPLFVYFHGYDLMFDMREQNGSGARIHSADYQNRIVNLSKRATFIANSNFSRQQLIVAGVPSDRIHLNYLGIPPNSAIKRLTGRRATILYVGRFVDCKGPDLTIQAFNEFRSNGNDAELVMVGDGPMRQRCQELAAASHYASDILLPGSESHRKVQERIEQATVFTMHSVRGPISGQEEAFGLAFLDAMSAGLPVVTGRSGGVPEIVQDGVTGFLVTPGDIVGHAAYLERLIKDRELASSMGEKGRSVAEQFSQERSDKGLHRILGSI